MKLHILLIILVLCCPAIGQKSISEKPSIQQIENIVLKEFGRNVRLEKDLNSTAPYLLGDFNGDNYFDIAILLNIEKGKSDIKNSNAIFLDTNPYSQGNGKILNLDDVGQNCLAIGILHGKSMNWNDFDVLAKYLTYECFSSFKLFKKSRLVKRGNGSKGATPKLKGDSIFLDLETGGTTLIYWNGQTYKGFGIRLGD